MCTLLTKQINLVEGNFGTELIFRLSSRLMAELIVGCFQRCWWSTAARARTAARACVPMALASRRRRDGSRDTPPKLLHRCFGEIRLCSPGKIAAKWAWRCNVDGTACSMMAWHVASSECRRGMCQQLLHRAATANVRDGDVNSTRTSTLLCSVSNTVTPSRRISYVARSHSNRVSLSLPLSHSHFQTNTAPLHPRVGGVNRLLDIIFVTFRSIISDSRSFRSMRDPNVLLGLLVESKRVRETAVFWNRKERRC